MSAEAASFGSMAEVKALFDRTLLSLLKLIPAERAVICFGERDLKPRVGHGLQLDNFWSNAPDFLREVRDQGVPVLHQEALGVPVHGPNGQVCGLLYADTVVRFTLDHLRQALKLVQTLQQQLDVIRSGKRTAPPPAAVAVPAPRRHVQVATVRLPVPELKAQALFFRSLATLVQAGIPLSRGLFILTLQMESHRMRRVAEELHQKVLRGRSVSSSMETLGVFSAFQIRLVAVGEKTGQLHRILERLATFEEAAERQRLRQRSALLYPAFVMLACLVTLVALPGFLLGGQFELLRQLHVELPPLTRWLQVFTWLGPLLLLPACVLVRKHWRRFPPAARVLKAQELARFAHSLGLQVEAGVSLLEALTLAGFANVADGVREGLTLEEALRVTGFFPRSFTEMVRVGEESGQLSRLLLWLADYYEQEVERKVEMLTALVEPTAMLVMGLLAAVILIGTLQPMVRALEAL